LQFFRPVALLFGDLATRNIATPTEVGLGISHPRRASEAATKALVGIRLDLRDARVDLAVRSFALHVAAAVTLVKLKRKTAIAVIPKGLGYSCPGTHDEDCRNQAEVREAHGVSFFLILRRQSQNVDDRRYGTFVNGQSSPGAVSSDIVRTMAVGERPSRRHPSGQRSSASSGDEKQAFMHSAS